ncbi:hypothetical protein R1flu_014960 [Riccia fluitans]|uniref:Beta-galactosidase n=1 Tax=Riccia fluitans TaxID=41844 RepID=A0ABD1YHJ9_9MARC
MKRDMEVTGLQDNEGHSGVDMAPFGVGADDGPDNCSGGIDQMVMHELNSAARAELCGGTAHIHSPALLLDGKRRFLQSGSIHYPRSTPQMWPGLIDLAKKGGIDVIQTYVFWDGHEPMKGMYNFSGRYDIVKFVKVVAAAGLYVNLRIGPYVCAEWDFGGFPSWLADVPGIEFRTDNEPFKVEMEGFTKTIVSLMKENNLFATQGGPIILAQIENEYGNIDNAYGDAAKPYISWAANMALGLETGVPWIMCQQEDAPADIINTCNGYYCDEFTPNAHNKPKMWTENWAGWFRNWGRKIPHRPVEDVAYAVARFFAKGGSFQNYYMYHGGTNFERTAGENIATSYDYDAPLDEYGQPREPKYSHLKELHLAIRACEPALAITNGDPFNSSLGVNTEAHVYGDGNGNSLEEFISSSTVCAAFLSNSGTSAPATVEFNGSSYELPAWSVSILPNCKNVVFNTAKVGTQTAVKKMTQIKGAGSDGQHSLAVGSGWESWQEPVSKWGETITHSGGFLDQLNLTKATSDYLWITTSVKVSTASTVTLRLNGVKDTVHIFVNGAYAGSPTDISVPTVEQTVSLRQGQNSIAVLSMTLGRQNYGPFLEKEVAGIAEAELVGLPTGDLNLTNQQWEYQVGLKGEQLRLYAEDGSSSVIWQTGTALTVRQPLYWYKTMIDAPTGNGPVALDLGSMGKGMAGINGISIGRYWTLKQQPSPGSDCTETCDYRGSYFSDKCTTGCGETARWYHVPRDWLWPTGNLLVIFEETGGDPTRVSLGTQLTEKVCAHISESHPVAPSGYGDNADSHPLMQLDCSPGYVISQLNFASYGTPSGKCGSFRKGSCHGLGSTEFIAKECVGKQYCTVSVTWEKFEAADPCPGLAKSLAVEAACAVYTLS